MEQQKVISKGVTLQCESSRVEEKHTVDTDYADDMTLLDNTEKGLQETIDLLCYKSHMRDLRSMLARQSVWPSANVLPRGLIVGKTPWIPVLKVSPLNRSGISPISAQLSVQMGQ